MSTQGGPHKRLDETSRRARIVRQLRRLVDTLNAANLFDVPAHEAHAAFTELLLLATQAGFEQPSNSESARLRCPLQEEIVERFFGLSDRYSWIARLAPERPRLLDCAAELALDVPTLDSGEVDAAQLGLGYEELLGYEMRCFSRDALFLKECDTWLEPTELLSLPGPERARFLRKEYGLTKNRVGPLSEPLRTSAQPNQVRRALAALDPKGVAGDRQERHWELVRSRARRHSGAHYTPRSLCELVVHRALSPVLPGDSRGILEVRVCDPAMGAGAFLLETARFLSEALVAAWQREGAHEPTETLRRRARHQVAERCLFGVDLNPIAVSLARAALGVFVGKPAQSCRGLDSHLCVGDALVGALPPRSLGDWSKKWGPTLDEITHPLAWAERFGEVFGRDNPGFDAVIGNPPWVAYVGRAAQPLHPTLARYYLETTHGFHRYRTLHGLFIERGAQLLRHTGRLGLVVPTSVCDLAGYGPTRAAHDAWCEVDPELPDFGDDAFESVFQPCMALLSTRRPGRDSAVSASTWELARDDLSPEARGLLHRLSQLPVLPPTLFGERGFQTTGTDLAYLRKLDEPLPPFSQPIREGVDIAEYRAHRPRTFIDTANLTGRFRPKQDWQQVKLLIRQTARFPIVAPSDGLPFRNSILAGFQSEEFSADLLLCLLNSDVIRWFHYYNHRDARQGMPQLKIGHLRRLPCPSAMTSKLKVALETAGSRMARGSESPNATLKSNINSLIQQAYALSNAEAQLVAAWARDNPLPKPRSAKT